MSDTNTDENEAGDPETTTINIRVTERQLEESDTVWKEEGYTSRSENREHERENDNGTEGCRDESTGASEGDNTESGIVGEAAECVNPN